MADPRRNPFAREDARERTRRDVARLRQREAGVRRFWRSLALIGSVGWPIVLLAAGGALLGRQLDVRWGTGVRFSLMLLALGTASGTWIAFRALGRDGR
ncbi:MAG TPA: AtpZ/AtpI family protein [Anaeromyxobacteraceae bacterium]|nr:AtpZ/AtpI family protein [Anaeromyxobacteraceae bacterium]